MASQKCKQLKIDVDHGPVNVNTETYYFDCFQFESGFASLSDAVIAREKFAGNPATNQSYAGYVKDAANWTCENGRISNDTIVINRYPGSIYTTGYIYPEPSRVAQVELGFDSPVSGSDTLILSGINVKGFTDYRVIFSSGGYFNTSAPDVFIKTDNGAWTQLNYTPDDSVNNQIIQHEISTGVTSADSLAIMLACHNSSDGQWIDDLGLIGTPILVSSILVNSEAGSVAAPIGGTLQMIYNVSPSNVVDSSVVWSVTEGTGSATIDNNGLLTPVAVGTITVNATANDGSGILGTKVITIVQATSITVSATGSATSIITNGGSLQMIAAVSPSTALQDVIWAIEAGDEDTASISTDGLLTAIRNGSVNVKATTTDGTDLSDVKTITLSNQIVELSDISITSANTIITSGDALILTATTTPVDATNQTMIWTIESSDSDTASISGNVLTPIRNGKVTVRVTSGVNDTIFDEMEITITNQLVPLVSVEITGNNITTNGGTSQMAIVPTPSDANNFDIVWSLSSAADSSKATISATGLVEAYQDGNITVVATDKNSSAVGERVLIISGQVVVSAFNFTTAGNDTAISVNIGSLQVNAEALPVNARIKDFEWSIVKADGNAIISNTGLVTAKGNGDVYAKATAKDAGAYADSIKISISGQVPVQSVEILVDTTTIAIDDGTLRLAVNVSPENAADTSLTWSIVGGTTNIALIDTETGLIKAVRNGTVIVKVTVNSNAALFDTAVVIISNQVVAPSSISLMGANSENTIEENDGTLQILASVNPSDAVADVIWGISGQKDDIASIDSTGLVTAFRDGVIFVQATSTIAPTISGRYEISIKNQVIEPISIKILSERALDSIYVNNGTLKLVAVATPSDAVRDVTWSIVSQDADTASISEGGILKAIRNGTVTVQAVSAVVDTVKDTFVVEITNQIIEPNAISIVSLNNSSTIDVNDGTLALSINVTPADAVKDVLWTMSSTDADTASVNANGVVQALRNGIATIMAISAFDSQIVDVFDVTITNQISELVAISVKGEGNSTKITSNKGTLQMVAEVSPTDADNSVLWSIGADDADLATINELGLLTAVMNGSVTVIATSTSVDTIFGEAEIDISGQIILVSEIIVSSEGDVSEISAEGGTLQMTTTVSPEDANDKSIAWSVSNDEIASISTSGLLTANANGEVTVIAAAMDGSETSGSMDITISNQVGIALGSEYGFILYPNPVKDVLYITHAKEIDYVEVIGVNGKVLISNKNFSKERLSLNTSELSEGVYVVRIYTNTKMFGFNIIK